MSDILPADLFHNAHASITIIAVNDFKVFLLFTNIHDCSIYFSEDNSRGFTHWAERYATKVNQ